MFQKAKIIFLCIKPNQLENFSNEIFEKIDQHKFDYSQILLVSILAGTDIKKIKSTLQLDKIQVIRVMPNTSLQIGCGCTAITKLDHKHFSVVKSVFDALGICEEVDESKFHAITGISGSGPAYVYTIIDALSDAGVKQGLPRDLATRFAAQTLLGTFIEFSFNIFSDN